MLDKYGRHVGDVHIKEVEAGLLRKPQRRVMRDLWGDTLVCFGRDESERAGLGRDFSQLN
jgi:hypothetical protein